MKPECCDVHAEVEFNLLYGSIPCVFASPEAVMRKGDILLTKLSFSSAIKSVFYNAAHYVCI